MGVERLTEAQKYTRALSETAGKGDEMSIMMKELNLQVVWMLRRSFT